MCSKDVSEEDEAIRCDGCEKWKHKECGKVPDEVIEDIKDEVVANETFWYCKEYKEFVIESFAKSKSKTEQTQKTQLKIKRQILRMMEARKTKKDLKKKDQEIKNLKVEIGKYKTNYEGTLTEVQDLKRQVNIKSNSNEDLKQINKELVIELTEKNKNISDGSNGANLKSVKGCKSQEDMIRQEVERYFVQRQRNQKKSRNIGCKARYQRTGDWKEKQRNMFQISLMANMQAWQRM